MNATKLGQMTLSSKLLTFWNNPKNKRCSAGQKTYIYIADFQLIGHYFRELQNMCKR